MNSTLNPGRRTFAKPFDSSYRMSSKTIMVVSLSLLLFVSYTIFGLEKFKERATLEGV